MEEVAPYDTQHLLPAGEMLYVFYDVEQSTWGFDSQERTGSKEQ
jgi:hypothetical protein